MKSLKLLFIINCSNISVDVYISTIVKFLERYFCDFDDEKQRLDDSETCLDLLDRMNLLRRYIIMDKAWIQFFVLEANRQLASKVIASASWARITFCSSAASKKVRQSIRTVTWFK